MKIFYIILFLFLFSCNSIKVQKSGMDSTQELVGKIKQIHSKSFRYPLSKNDSIHTEISVLFFDKQNRVLKQIDKYYKFTDETVFNYKNGLLESTITKSGNRINKTEYKYDERKNMSKNTAWENDTLYFVKTSIYDKHNNPIEETYIRPHSKSLNSTEKFAYDYKNRTITIQGTDETNVPRNHYLKQYFDKKGFIIKTEFIYTDSNSGFSRISKIEYDKSGNLTKRTQFDNDGKIKAFSNYKNLYDKKGNIIQREKYLNEKIIEKTINEITYW